MFKLGTLCLSSKSFYFVTRKGIISECTIDHGFNSLVSPCCVVLLESLRKKIGSGKYCTKKLFATLFSDGSLFLISMIIDHALLSEDVKVNIKFKKLNQEQQKVGEILITRDDSQCLLFISSPYENCQTGWIELSNITECEVGKCGVVYKNYYDSVGSTIDEEQVPCLGTITHSLYHDIQGRDGRLVCCSFSGSHNQYCQHVRGTARFSVCQNGSRLIPFMPMSDSSIIEGSPEIVV